MPSHRLTLAAVVLVPLAACTPPPPPPPPTTTAVTATAATPAGGATTCTGAFTWRYHLAAPAAGTGITADQNNARQYDFPSAVGVCAYQDAAVGLRPGTWQITVLNLQCTVRLTAVSGYHSLAMNTCAIDVGVTDLAR